MPTSFQEFLHQKAEEFGHLEQVRLRGVWVGALQRLHDRIKQWLQESDPEGFLEFWTMAESVFDPHLGTFEAPVLDIRLGEASIRVRPMGWKVIGPSRSELGGSGRVEGRVDFIERRSGKAVAYRVVGPQDQDETWWIAGELGGLTPLDRGSLESLLQDLWS